MGAVFVWVTINLISISIERDDVWLYLFADNSAASKTDLSFDVISTCAFNDSKQKGESLRVVLARPKIFGRVNSILFR